MTRLGKTPTRGEFDLAQAFKYLGKDKSYRDLEIAANLLRESGIEVVYDQELQDLAEANGSSALNALDLAVAVAYGVEALYAGPRAGKVANVRHP